MLIPSIDLYDGKAVQWRQGKEPVLARDDVYELLEHFSLCGEVALIDLNAALGQGDNKALIKKLLKQKRCRVGGGIRHQETALEYLRAGASKLILGTAATEEWVKLLPRDRLIFAIDAKGDDLVVKGWTETSGQRVLDALPALAQGCSELLYTQVQKEGLLQGMDRERIDAILKTASVPVTIAGGISSTDDLRWLQMRGANAQIGMAIYTGVFSIEDALCACIHFDQQPLIPTIVQDIETQEVLMLAYSNRESLKLALQEKAGIYWSRSRQQLWRKGEQSGHRQQLLQVDYDCDGDSLLFMVRQTQQSCHLQRWSCFATQNQRFSLKTLDIRLQQRQRQASDPALSSYSMQLFRDANLRAEKLREETQELIEATTPEHVRWEAADLFFFALTDALAKGVSLAEIENELASRQRTCNG